MKEAVVRFSNFEVGADMINAIGDQAHGGSRGVIPEIASTFGQDWRDLKGMTAAITPMTTLQDNIVYAETILSTPDAKIAAGSFTNTSAVKIAHDWVVRSGLQEQVFRPLMRPSRHGESEALEFDVAVEAEDVVNWMNRMTTVAATIAKKHPVHHMLLASSNRLIGGDEHPLVPAGVSTDDFMQEILEPQLELSGLFETIEFTTKFDSDKTTMAAAVNHLEMMGIDLTNARILVPAVAGNWLQKGVQLRQAAQAVRPEFDTDIDNPQIWVASDSLPVGITGEEPKTTHQNPYSAIGNILLSAVFLEKLANDR